MYVMRRKHKGISEMKRHGRRKTRRLIREVGRGRRSRRERFTQKSHENLVDEEGKRQKESWRF